MFSYYNRCINLINLIEEANNIELMDFDNVNVEIFQTVHHSKEFSIKNKKVLERLATSISNLKVRKIRLFKSSFSAKPKPYNTFKLEYTIPGYKNLVIDFMGGRYVYVSSPYISDVYKLVNDKDIIKIYEIIISNQNINELVDCKY